MTRLCLLANETKTDKGPVYHNYTPIYHYLFSARSIKNILEIGIDKGYSLRLWEEYLPKAEIWGIDNDPEKLINSGRVHSILGDQGQEGSLIAVREQLSNHKFEVIIDDGSHIEEHQLLTMKILLPNLTVGGLYIIEDIATPERIRILSNIEARLSEDYTVSLVARWFRKSII